MELWVEGSDFRLQQLRAAASAAGVALNVHVGKPSAAAPVPANPWGVLPVLHVPGRAGQPGVTVARTISALRVIGAARGDAELLGESDGLWGEARVDEWLEWAWANLDASAVVALGVVKAPAALDAAKSRIPPALAHLNARTLPRSASPSPTWPSPSRCRPSPPHPRWRLCSTGPLCPIWRVG